jgi:hypothetical protein
MEMVPLIAIMPTRSGIPVNAGPKNPTNPSFEYHESSSSATVSFY